MSKKSTHTHKHWTLPETSECEWDKKRPSTKSYISGLLWLNRVDFLSPCIAHRKKNDDSQQKKLWWDASRNATTTTKLHICVHCSCCRLISFQLKPTLNNELFIFFFRVHFFRSLSFSLDRAAIDAVSVFPCYVCVMSIALWICVCVFVSVIFFDVRAPIRFGSVIFPPSLSGQIVCN